MSIFFELGAIIIVAAVVSIVMRALRQPLIAGYIITGVLVSPALLGLVRSVGTIQELAHVGVAFLLFIVGLNLNPRAVREVGAVAVVTGLGQIIFTALAGFFLLRYFGFTPISAGFMALGLTFSSTIVIMKMLADKGDLDTLYGRISIGFLLVQDLVAIVSLMLVAARAHGESIGMATVNLLMNGILLGLILWLVVRYVLPRVDWLVARSQEALFLFSLAWLFAVAAVFTLFGFSFEIGALAAGVALALSPYQYEISAKVRPLRDFFLILFFVSLGLAVNPAAWVSMMPLAIVLSLFVLIGNPLITMIILGALGYKQRTSFMAGLTVAQVSEFSLILIGSGVALGYLPSVLLPLITLVALITMGISSYMIAYGEIWYLGFAPLLFIFERKHARASQVLAPESYEVLLFGYNRIGFDLVKTIKRQRRRLLVIDFNPEVIKRLEREGVMCRYGDADDGELLAQLDFASAQMMISTIPDFETTMTLLHHARSAHKAMIKVVVAQQINDAEAYYRAGATYVVMPHFLGGEHAAQLIKKHGLKRRSFMAEQKKHRAYLRAHRRVGG